MPKYRNADASTLDSGVVLPAPDADDGHPEQHYSGNAAGPHSAAASASTTVDPSSGIGTIPSASRSDVDKTVDAGKLAVPAKPARKFGIKGFALIRAPA